MQSVWSTKASFNGIRSWDDQNYHGEGMLLCFYQSRGEAPHVRSWQGWKNVGLLKTTDLHCPQSFDVHRNFSQDLWRTQFLQLRMNNGKGYGLLYLRVLAAAELNRLVWLHFWSLLPVRRFGRNTFYICTIFEGFPRHCSLCRPIYCKTGWKVGGLHWYQTVLCYTCIFLHFLHIVIKLGLINQRILSFTVFLDLTVWMLWPVHLSALMQTP